MRITITQGAFLPVPPLRGGAVEKVWFELGKEFAKAGHFVTHISRAFSGLPKSGWIENVNHVRVQAYDAPKSILLLKALDLFYSIRVARHLPAADILVTNTFWLPVIVRSQKWGQLYVHVARYPRGQMKLYRHAARLQTVSDPIKEAIATEVDVSESKLSTLPYPVWGLDVRAEAPVHARRKEILFVGRIHPEKGLHLLIEAFLHISPMKRKEWRLVIVGSTEFNTGGGGPGYREAILGRAALLGDKIDWVGPVYESIKLNEFYRRASLFVYPSLAERGRHSDWHHSRQCRMDVRRSFQIYGVFENTLTLKSMDLFLIIVFKSHLGSLRKELRN